MNISEQPIKPNSLSIAETQQPAGFWIRCGAFAIDFLLAVFIALIPTNFLSSDIFFTIILLLLFITIHIFSPGKRIAGITVVSIVGTPLTYFHCIARCILGPILVPLLLGLLLILELHFFSVLDTNINNVQPSIWIFWGSLVVIILFLPAALPHKRAVHDYLVRTRVIYIKKIKWWRKTGVICAGLLLIVFGVMYISLSL